MSLRCGFSEVLNVFSKVSLPSISFFPFLFFLFFFSLNFPDLIPLSQVEWYKKMDIKDGKNIHVNRLGLVTVICPF